MPVWNNGILITRIIPFPVPLKLAPISYIIILVAKLVYKYPLAGVIHLLCILLTSVVWIQMGHLFPENNFYMCCWTMSVSGNLTVEENTAVLEKCPESYVAFKNSHFKLLLFCLDSLSTSVSYLLHKFYLSVLKMRFFHISPQIMWLLPPFPSSLMLFSVSFKILKSYDLYLFCYAFWITMSTKGLVPINALEIRNPHFLSTTMVGVSIKYFSPAVKDLPWQRWLFFLELVYAHLC